MGDRAVTIKGTRDGLVITLGEGPLDAVMVEVERRLRARASFFRGGRVALGLGDRALAVDQLRSIGATLEQLGMTLWAVDTFHPTTFVAALALGLETSVGTRQAALLQTGAPVSLRLLSSLAPNGLTREDLPGLVVRRTLLAGQKIHYAGHITLLGDVQRDAEIVAGGDIIVWGMLRGMVHAGAMGDSGAVVCALELAPSQLRIASCVAHSPQQGPLSKQPQMARVQDGAIVVERWERKRADPFWRRAIRKRTVGMSAEDG